MAGDLAPKSGSATVDGRLGVLRQNVQAGNTGVAEALGVAAELARLDRIEAGAAEPEDFEQADWTLPARVREALASVGLPDLEHGRAVSTLSAASALDCRSRR